MILMIYHWEEKKVTKQSIENVSHFKKLYLHVEKNTEKLYKKVKVLISF